ncbi:MAG: hypothetical protein FWC77_07165, partial [Defluviitaleaceae bacterium]|nr:hypothetical protein [Defluviitaleaceae bacterium]
MSKAIVRKLQNLVIVVLIISLLTPTLAYASVSTVPAQYGFHTWDSHIPHPNLPVIEPFYIGGPNTELPATHPPNNNMPADEIAEWSYFNISNGISGIADQSQIDRLQDEQANYWMQCPSIQKAFRFYEIRNGSATFSSLSLDDRNLVLRQLSIAEGAFGVANELFLIMEQDGFSLEKSVDMLVIMSVGLFSYTQAKNLIANIPCRLERNTEIMRFEQFALNFDLPHYVAARRLIDSSVPIYGHYAGARHGRTFADVHSFLAVGNYDTPYSFIEAALTEEMKLLGMYPGLGYFEWGTSEDDEEPGDEDDEEYVPEPDDEYIPEPEDEEYIPEPEDEPINDEDFPPVHGEELSYCNEEYHPVLHEERNVDASMQGNLASEVRYLWLDENHPVIEGGQVTEFENYTEGENEYPPEHEENPEDDEEYHPEPEDEKQPDDVYEYPPEEEDVDDEDNDANNVVEDAEPTPQRPIWPIYPNRSSRIGLDNTRLTRPWRNRNQHAPEYVLATIAISTAFTNEYAFNIARQMFLDNRGVAEIQATFALGAALQVEPQTFMLPAGIYRAESRANFTRYSATGSVLNSPTRGNNRERFGHNDPYHGINTFYSDAISPGAQPIPPSMPAPVRFVLDLPPVIEQPFDVSLVIHLAHADASEIDYIVEYGMEIMGVDAAPMTASMAPMTTTPTHENIIRSPFTLDFDANESVCLNTGAAMYRINILSLPGRGGFGFNLGMVYNSGEADLRLLGQNTTPTWPASQLRHGLGIGWKFDLPHILGNVLYLPGRGSFVLDGNTILGHTLQDMRLFNDASFASGSRWSNRRLTFNNGTSYFFDGNLLIGMRDRFGNTIRIEYVTIHGWGTLISRVIDTNGSHINFSNQISGTNRTITITSPDGGTFIINMSHRADISSFSTFPFQITSVQNQTGAVTAFYNNVITTTYVKGPAPTLCIGCDRPLSWDDVCAACGWSNPLPPCGRCGMRLLPYNQSRGSCFICGQWHWRMECAVCRGNLQPCGTCGTCWRRPIPPCDACGGSLLPCRTCTACGRQPGSEVVQNRILLLSQVSYPGGAILRFSYGLRNVPLGNNGHRVTPIVTERYLLSQGQNFQRTTFSYQGTPSASPSNQGHTYSTTVTQNNGLRTVYTFNYRNLNTQQRTYFGTSLQSAQIIAYNSDQLPTSITLTEHSGGHSRTTTQQFTYNRYGQVTQAISPLAQGSTNPRYTTTTTYDSRFGLPQT